MLKTVKMHEEAYRRAKKLAKLLESKKVLKGVYKVSITTAISYAITTTLEDIERRRRVKTVNKKTIAKL